MKAILTTCLDFLTKPERVIYISVYPDYSVSTAPPKPRLLISAIDYESSDLWILASGTHTDERKRTATFLNKKAM